MLAGVSAAAQDIYRPSAEHYAIALDQLMIERARDALLSSEAAYRAQQLAIRAASAARAERARYLEEVTERHAAQVRLWAREPWYPRRGDGYHVVHRPATD